MPSMPAGTPSMTWRSMTTELLPTSLVVTCSIAEMSAEVSPKAVALSSR